MNLKEPKVLGFYKEEGDEIIVGELKGNDEGLYLELPSGIRNRLEIVVGNRIRFFLEAILDKNGNISREIKKEIVGEVIGYWNELHLRSEEVRKCSLNRGDILKICLKSVIQFGEERDV